MVEHIFDRNGSRIGTIEKNSMGGVNVYNAAGTKIGYTDGKNTYDQTGSIISRSDCPGLLLKG